MDEDPSPSPVTQAVIRISQWLRGMQEVPPPPAAQGNGVAVVDPTLETERQLLENVRSLKNLEAADIMIPRADIIAFADNAPVEEVLASMRQHEHSRYPVYHDTLDDIVGVIQVKRAFDLISSGDGLDLARIIEKPLFTVASARAMDLLVQMRVTGVHLALVVDEYGGIDGLVTMQDVVEALFGTIQNTNGHAQNIVRQQDGSILIDGRTELETLEVELGQSLPLDQEERDDIDTVAGLVFYKAGHVPVPGEIVSIKEGLEFEVIDADPRRIRWLKVL